MKSKTPIVLIICDGLGHREETEHNAVFHAATPNLDYYWKNYPHAILEAAGESIGLPEGQMGTSEANHLIIGSGRIIYQNLVKINKAAKDGDLERNEVVLGAFNHAKQHDGSLHIIGMVSPGGVHNHTDHMKALVAAAKKCNIEKIKLHLFTDGRDTPPKSALEFIADMENFLKQIGIGKIVTLGGRYWGMDRDNNLHQTEKAFSTIAKGEGEKFASAKEAVEASYSQNITDEFIEPCVITNEETEGAANSAAVLSGDAVIFTHFRADRARQLAIRFSQENIPDVFCAAMTKCDDNLPFPIIFPPEEITNTLSDILSRNDLKQLRITETEKFTHLTFFFNAQKYEADKGEDRIMFDSNKVAKLHDEKPEMKAMEIAEKIVEIIPQQKYNFIATNLVNCDVVGHSGVFEAIKTAVTTVDTAVKKIVDAAQANGVDVIITADHGNAA